MPLALVIVAVYQGRALARRADKWKEARSLAEGRHLRVNAVVLADEPLSPHRKINQALRATLKLITQQLERIAKHQGCVTAQDPVTGREIPPNHAFLDWPAEAVSPSKAHIEDPSAMSGDTGRTPPKEAPFSPPVPASPGAGINVGVSGAVFNHPIPQNPQAAETSRGSGAALKTKWHAEEQIGHQYVHDSFETERLSRVKRGTLTVVRTAGSLAARAG
ncbi:hypothetical protein NDU88_005248 [Pleurodeles waltl]|uniref:Uncharacterized protein n=1 Tax=Pleurodeles waltl TaxID=8319 RepID=A0AAV7NRP2_PLEWA|nr:hypothetical protein NDU88_005248 [Pleurodeles waltl]